jgi:voltage-gated potassium channel
VAALAVIPLIVVDEAYPHGTGHEIAETMNWLIWGLFTVEVALILLVAPRKEAAARAHWLDIAIVLFTAPFLPAVFASLRLIRLARVARLVRLVRLGLLGWRAVDAQRVLISRRGFRYFAIATAFLVLVTGVAVHVADAEHFPNIWLGIWWAIVTVTTVGYGDVVPHTVSGRIVGGGLMVLGIGFVALLTATIASSFVAQDASEQDARDADRDAKIALRLDEAVIEISQEMQKLDERLARIERAVTSDQA